MNGSWKTWALGILGALIAIGATVFERRLANVEAEIQRRGQYLGQLQALEKQVQRLEQRVDQLAERRR